MTVEVVWTTGAEVRRGFWEEYYESLSLDTKHVRMGRLINGAPLLANHSSWSLSSQIGVVQSARIEGEKGLAVVRFSDRQEVQSIVKDVENGIIRNVSVGYLVHQYEDISDRDEKGLVKKRRLKAVDWEPLEISLVTIPADPAAQVRNEINELFNVEIIERKYMPEDLKTKVDPVTPLQSIASDAQPPEQKTTENKSSDDFNRGMEEERKRVKKINEIVSKVNLPDTFARKLIEEGIKVSQARELVIEELAKLTKQTAIRNSTVEVTIDETVTRRTAVENALLNRFDGKKYQLTDHGKKYRNLTLVEIGKEVLIWNGKKVDSARAEIAQRALHTTSDFPELLANVANKTLRDGYQSTPQTFEPFVRWINAPDFKEMSRIQMGEAPKLEEITEAGEYKAGTIKEGKEKYAIKTYGKKIGITRQVIINDDLDAFTRVPQMIGVQASHLESDLVWGLITANAAMSDTIALFHSSHSNLAASSAAIDITPLSVARSSMRGQKGLDGKTPINVTPTHLVVPAALETKAQQFLATNIRQTSTKATDVNPFAGEFGLVVEVRLDANSATAWYVFSSASLIDMIEVATLDGMRGPTIESKNGWDVDGVEIKAKYDIGAKVIDYRGMFKNAGA